MQAINQPTNIAYKKYLPVFTAVCSLTSLILFLGINLEGSLESWDSFKKWGAPSFTDIYDGAYWGLITSNFLHIEIWHIAFNLYWFWIFGKKIEFEKSKGFFIVLILSSAVISSLSQLAFSDTAGIGLSGIVYTFFGYLWIKGRSDERFKGFLTKGTVNLFLFWLAICVVLTRTGVWEVGNAAHVGGMLWGMAIAYVAKYQIYTQLTVGLAYIAFLKAVILYSPLSTSYLSYKAYQYHNEQKFKEARELYQQILKVDNDNQWAKENLQLLPAE